MTRPTTCEGRHRNARHHVKDGIGGNFPLYSRAPLLSRGFAKKVFRKIFGKSVDNADTAVYNERRQAETAGKTEGEKSMIIDIILDRYDDERDGLPHAYDPREFYWEVMKWSDLNPHADLITSAMDGGTEDDVRRELCAYIDAEDYNPSIKFWINGRTWIS